MKLRWAWGGDLRTLALSLKHSKVTIFSKFHRVRTKKCIKETSYSGIQKLPLLQTELEDGSSVINSLRLAYKFYFIDKGLTNSGSEFLHYRHVHLLDYRPDIFGSNSNFFVSIPFWRHQNGPIHLTNCKKQFCIHLNKCQNSL